MNAAYSFLRTTILPKYFGKTGTAAMLFAALMHDIEHTGRNNMFEINSASKLAIRYNDDSVLENHHSARAFLILSQAEFNIFNQMHANEFPQFRQYVIQAILSTDIKKHFTELAQFKGRIDSVDFSPYEDDGDQSDFLLLIGVLLHTCDLYVPTLDTKRSMKWSKLVNTEFINQSNYEIANMLPVTPFLKGLEDMKKQANSEKFFITKIVNPLWLEVDRFLQGDLAQRLSNIEENLINWGEILQKHTEIEQDKNQQEFSSDSDSESNGPMVIEELREPGEDEDSMEN